MPRCNRPSWGASMFIRIEVNVASFYKIHLIDKTLSGAKYKP